MAMTHAEHRFGGMGGNAVNSEGAGDDFAPWAT
jgi:hypothetical protein